MQKLSADHRLSRRRRSTSSSNRRQYLGTTGELQRDHRSEKRTFGALPTTGHSAFTVAKLATYAAIVLIVQPAIKDFRRLLLVARATDLTSMQMELVGPTTPLVFGRAPLPLHVRHQLGQVPLPSPEGDPPAPAGETK